MYNELSRCSDPRWDFELSFAMKTIYVLSVESPDACNDLSEEASIEFQYIHVL